MGKFERIIIYSILGISLVFSIFALCRAYPRESLGFDYMGVIVGSIGWLLSCMANL